MMDIFGDGEMDMDAYALMNEKLISPTGHNYNGKSNHQLNYSVGQMMVLWMI